jgi:hypothetical protein
MKARRIIEGAAFGPEGIRAAGTAFDAAWGEIADRFGADMHGEARDHLAASIISAARDDSADVEALRRAGLTAMARHYPLHLIAPTTPAEPPSAKVGGADD